jgi:hypothetical protein
MFRAAPARSCRVGDRFELRRYGMAISYGQTCRLPRSKFSQRGKILQPRHRHRRGLSLSGELIAMVAPSVQRKACERKSNCPLVPGLKSKEIELRDGRWVLSARAAGERSCPVCGVLSRSRHDWHHRRLQDLPVQGTPLVLDLRLGRCSPILRPPRSLC